MSQLPATLWYVLGALAIAFALRSQLMRGIITLARPDILAVRSAADEAAQVAQEKTIAALKILVDSLQTRIAVLEAQTLRIPALEAEVASLRHDKLINEAQHLADATTITHLRQKLDATEARERQLWRYVQKLEEALRMAGIDVPKLTDRQEFTDPE